jgi:uncharacterized protein (TIGR02996 family)
MLEQDYSNNELRLVYADWLEDQGNTELAYCQRWMALHNKRPEEAEDYWLWRNPFNCFGEVHSTLYSVVYDALRGYKRHFNTAYNSRWEAEASLCDVLTEMLSVLNLSKIVKVDDLDEERREATPWRKV